MVITFVMVIIKVLMMKMQGLSWQWDFHDSGDNVMMVITVVVIMMVIKNYDDDADYSNDGDYRGNDETKAGQSSGFMIMVSMMVM